MQWGKGGALFDCFFDFGRDQGGGREVAPAVYNAVSDCVDFIGRAEYSPVRVEKDFEDALKYGFRSGLRYGDTMDDAIPPRVRQFCGCREQPFDVSFCEAFFAVHVEVLVFNRGTAGVDGEYYGHGGL